MKLTSKGRADLPASNFAFPPGHHQAGKYPMPDAAHAANAKARASGQFNAGKLSASGKATVDAKANKVLHRGSGRGR